MFYRYHYIFLLLYHFHFLFDILNFPLCYILNLPIVSNLNIFPQILNYFCDQILYLFHSIFCDLNILLQIIMYDWGSGKEWHEHYILSLFHFFLHLNILLHILNYRYDNILLFHQEIHFLNFLRPLIIENDFYYASSQIFSNLNMLLRI